MIEYALIVDMPDAEGPGTETTAVYGPESGRSGKESLEGAGHLLCDGSSGWSFVVVPWPLPPIQPPQWGDV